MNIRDVYKSISDLNTARDSFYCLVLDGPCRGGTGLLNGQEWRTAGGDFLPRHTEELMRQVSAHSGMAQHESGILCIDGTNVYMQRLTGRQKIVLCGAGTVGLAVIRFAKILGYEVTALEDRSPFAQKAEEAGADHVICGDYTQGLSQVHGDEDTWFVIMTMGHLSDGVCLQEISRKEHAYIGMMGSRRRVRLMLDYIGKQGADPEILRHVHAPIGLSIHARTPEEIALSVLAEITDLRNSRNAAEPFPHEILDVMDGLPDSEPAILATVIQKEGSAPQDPGARMLVRTDGGLTCTVGGGYLEAVVARRALEILGSAAAPSGAPDAAGAGNPKERRGEGFEIMDVSLESDDVVKAPMICGGSVRVALQRI